MQQFARFGAEARLQAISDERDEILRAFPDFGRASAQANVSLDGAAPARRASAPARKRRRMSAAERKAVGKRMKAYWAAKRTQKVNGAGEGTQSKTAGQNGAPSSKRRGNAGRKQGRKK
jgi:hypothetical protein